LAASIVGSHAYLSHKEYESRYGADPADLKKIADFADKYGLKVLEHDRARRIVKLTGPIGAFNEAFGLELKTYQANFATYRSHTEAISVPAELADIVEWVFGLHNQPVYHKQHLSNVGPEAGGVLQSYTTPQLAQWYDFPAGLNGQGQCLGVLEIYGGYQESDLQTYFDSLQIQQPEIVNVGENCWATEPDNYWANFEVTMDIQVASSLAPGARTVVYFSGAQNDQDTTAWTYFDLISQAVFDVENKPSVLTMSWGLPEALSGVWTEAEAWLINELFVVASLFGITVCLPSGDSGAIFPSTFGMFSAPALAYFPASSPWVLSCGGTSLITNGGQIEDEVVWNRLSHHMRLLYLVDPPPSSPRTQGPFFNLGATGGGVSIYFALPAYQEKAQVPEFNCINFVNFQFSDVQSFNGRGVPDVAANADFLTGYKIFVDGQWRSGGGTSASTPLWAGLVACINQGLGRRAGFLNPYLYQLKLDDGNTDIFRDITRGNNGGFEAAPDKMWNPCTGLGTPRGSKLLAALKNIYLENEA
jgi:kumamolisin